MQNEMLPWFSILSLLLYIPVLCYLDWKHRDIGTHKLWLPLLAINIPVVSAAYLTGLYSPIMLPLTLAFSLVWLYLFRKRMADGAWLICITMFAVINPRTGMNFIQPFLMYLIIFTAATFWGIWLDKRIRKPDPLNVVTRSWSDFKMKNGIPFLIPISLAFIAAVVM